MRELRLIGVHDDGQHLVVTDDAGAEYRLRIDDKLRAAARRDRPAEEPQIPPEQVTPRDVQAMIRAGATADEVATRTGWDLAKIARFEGPVLAEREHVAARAQSVRMRGTDTSGAPETLAQRAAARFATRGVEPDAVSWDACRDAEGQWTVSAIFVAGGRERSATWWFDQAGMSVVAKNDEAKWLSEADAPSGPVPSSVHRPTAVFDVEVEEERAQRADRPQPDELINSMREHSGAKQRRSGRRRARATAAPVEEALPFDTGEVPPAARGTHPRDVEEAKGAAPVPDDEAPTAEVPVTRTSDEEGSDYRTGHVTPQTREEEPPASQERLTSASTDAPEEASGGDTAPATTSEQDASGAAAQDQGSGADTDQGPDGTDGQDVGDQGPGKGKGGKSKGGRGKRGRASVPSWDDVMFGSKRD